MRETFAELELREWADAKVASSYAKDFAQASEMCVPGFSTALAGCHHVLDLCCGHGIIAQALVAGGAVVTCADFSTAMLDLARARVPTAWFVHADATELPFDPNCFDGIAIGFGMPHFQEPPVVLAECARVLKPGGRLAYTVWHGAEKTSALAAVFDAMATYGSPDVQLPPGPGANDYAQPDIAFPALEAAGFSDCRLTTIASAWTTDEASAPFRFFEEGTARGGFLLRNQPAAAAAAIREAVEDWVRSNCQGPPWHIPNPAALITAVRT